MTDPPSDSRNAAPSPGDRLAQYEVISQAGAGGMGVVYRALDVDLHRNVALKVLRASGTSTADSTQGDIERLIYEARSAARLNHPNTVAIYQVGRHQGLTFIAMEWVDGGSMAEHLRRSIFLDWREATTAIRDATLGLAAAHKAGIIHRDLKPANLMRTADGWVKVVDFGLCRVADVPTLLTQTGAVLGTPAYLSPEQCRGEPATVASDIYSLTCTYFHLLTSRPPFDAPNALGMLQKHLSEPFPDARRFADDLPLAVLTILDRGSQKNLAERYASCAQLLTDLEAALNTTNPPLTAITPSVNSLPVTAVASMVEPPHNLPGPTNTFFGRSSELNQARQLLATNRLLTLIGPGGTGKTRLSQQIARSMFSDFSGGVWFIELAGLAEGAQVVDAICTAVEVRAAIGQTPTTALLDRLKPSRSLLLMDNCEHVINEAGTITVALLAGCPLLRIVATSRQALGCQGEIELRVPALTTIPISSELPPLPKLVQVDAIALFVDRAAGARPGFSLTADNASHVVNICARLDGIPLAIELAASRIKILSAAQIAERLQDAFKLLTTGPRTLLPRQRTLRALIDWSYDLLSDAERTVFARLSLFAGSCALDSAEQIISGGPIEPEAVLDLLSELADKSLLLVEERDGTARYRMLSTIRDYAAEKLTASGQRAEFERKHLEHFVAFAEAAVTRFNGPEQSQSLNRLDADHDNIRAALDHSTDLPLTLRLSAAIARYWFLRGNVIDGLARLQKTIAQAGDVPSIPLAQLLKGAGILAQYRGETALANDYNQRALLMARELNDLPTQAQALNNIATLLKEEASYPQAIEILEQVLAIYEKLGDEPGLASTYNNLGCNYMEMGDYPKSRELLDRSRTIHERLGNVTWVAYGRLNVGEIEFNLHNISAARQHFQVCLRMLEDLRDEWGVAYALEALGKCDLLSGDLDNATERFDKTLRIVRKLGDKRVMASQYVNLAQAALRKGDAVSAIDLANQSLSLQIELKDRLGLAESMETLAEARRNSDPHRSAVLLGCADTIRKEIRSPRTPSAMESHRTLLSELRTSLGEERFTAAFDSGHALEPSMEQLAGPT